MSQPDNNIDSESGTGSGAVVGVLGGGTWGMALARAARRAGSDTILSTRRRKPGSIKALEITKELAPLARARVIIVAVPSKTARTIARALGDHLDGSHLLVHGVRGLSGDELLTISQIFREETPCKRLGALGGPVQAAELNEGRASAMVVASPYADVLNEVRAAMQSDWLQVHTTTDLIGLEWASALVGCLSIGVGYVQQRQDVSPGLLAALVSRAVDEAAAIARAAGGTDDRTFYHLGGYGDLLASMSLHDRPEVVLGRELADGATLDEAQLAAKLRIEAIELVPRIAVFARTRGVKCPIFSALSGILQGEGSPEDIVRALFSN